MAGGEADEFGPETGDVVFGARERHEFDGAAGGPESEGPEGVLATPTDHGVDGGGHEALVETGILVQRPDGRFRSPDGSHRRCRGRFSAHVIGLLSLSAEN